MTKERKYLISKYFLKFNSAQIKFDSNVIIMIKKSYIDGIFSVINYVANFTNFRQIIRKMLLSKEQYLAQKAKNAYITSKYQLKASFDLF